MTGSLRTPVVIVLFNRPERTRELVDALRRVRPERLFVIADGPREDRPDDARLCAAARQTIDSVDWPCRIERNEADRNLGCDVRIPSGLDWAFDRVERAIILEDDVLPTPDFFGWAERMLDRHEADENIATICGSNPLAVWGDPSADSIMARRGSEWGWATWAKAWKRTIATSLAGDPASARHEIASLGLDPLLSEHLAIYLAAWREQRLSAWGPIYSVQMALTRQWAVVSPTNLTENRGAGPDATRMTYLDDFFCDTPVFAARPPAAQNAAAQGDPSFDRAYVLAELLSRCANPTMALRLAKALSGETAHKPSLPVEPRMRHHLAPFMAPGEALAVLDHLLAHGLRTPQAKRIAEALRAIQRPAA